MKLSNFFLPLSKDLPADATIISHQLMLKSGLISKVNSGIYSWLPLGVKIIENISKIIADNLEKAHINKIIMPITQPADLWQESQRYDAYGQEMLRFKDRHNKELLFGPTAEEIATDIFRKYVKSYKEMPINLYQINWKFRDEIRPRFGVMRAREFLMKDAYSFALNETQALEIYETYYSLYLKIFKEMGLTAIPVQANTGAIGGNLSHEFHILAATGESTIYAESNLLHEIAKGNYSYDKLKNYYAAADERHNPTIAPKDLIIKKGIEVGHIFNFADKYSTSLNALVKNNQGKDIAVNMGSYGIGVSRLVAAIIEYSHDAKGIIWPKEIAPFTVIINPLNLSDPEIVKASSDIYNLLQNKNISVILDDSNKSIGEKFACHDLIGLPYQIIIGQKSLKEGNIEIKERKSGISQLIKLHQLENYPFN
jgi:prolyl-tRNA synthetase